MTPFFLRINHPSTCRGSDLSRRAYNGGGKNAYNGG